jgi:hypothetical protein
MAQIAELSDRRFSGEVVPMRGTTATEEEQTVGRIQSSTTEQLRVARAQARNAMISTKESFGGIYRHAHKRAFDSFTPLTSASRGIASRARNRAQHLKKEHPLQLLAIISGAAFTLGVAVRIWRSRHHAE